MLEAQYCNETKSETSRVGGRRLHDGTRITSRRFRRLTPAETDIVFESFHANGDKAKSLQRRMSVKLEEIESVIRVDTPGKLERIARIHGKTWNRGEAA